MFYFILQKNTCQINVGTNESTQFCNCSGILTKILLNHGGSKHKTHNHTKQNKKKEKTYMQL